MASKELVIDKDYFIDMKNYLENESRNLETQLSLYIAILENASSAGLISGETAVKLRMYLHNAKKLKGKLQPAATDAVKALHNLLLKASTENDRKM